MVRKDVLPSGLPRKEADELLVKVLFTMERISQKYSEHVARCLIDGIIADYPPEYVDRLMADDAFMAEVSDAYIYWRAHQ